MATQTKVFIKVILLLITSTQAFRNNEVPLLSTKSGWIKGHVTVSPEGSVVQEFLGIPFAEPPIGCRRFADPVPVQPWSGIYEAMSFGDSCIQPIDTTFGNFSGSTMWNAPKRPSEDCLYLNVWTPHPRPRNSAVMVWIYGGGFFSGTSSLAVYDGKILASHTNVIVVSFNYRLGALGYLATGDGRLKGNYGMKDQVVALEWINKNIASFGGNPASITIFGESAGAASVGYHLLSPMSRHLFSRAILESGTPAANWAYMTADQAKARSTQFFKTIGCVDDDDVISCLRDSALTPDEIMQKEYVDLRFLVFPWVPCVDGEFLTHSPREHFNRGDFKKADILLGANKDEGTYFILYGVDGYKVNDSSMQSQRDFWLNVETVEWDYPPYFQDLIRYRYTNWLHPRDPLANRDSLDDVVGDRSFLCPTVEMAKLYAGSHANVFFYHLTYRASNEVWPDWMGVIHGADVQYVFGMPLDASQGYNYDDARLAHIVMTYWSNFAKTGNPNGHVASALPFWPRHTEGWGEYLAFEGGQRIIRRTGPLRESYCNFWDTLRPFAVDPRVKHPIQNRPRMIRRKYHYF